jgi:hypothetical protein
MPEVATRKRTTPGVQVTVNPDPADQTPKPAEPRKEKPSLWEFIASIPTDEWREYCVYIYRERPKVSMMGQGGYLTILTQPFSPEDIKRLYGGGGFKAMILKSNKMAGGGTWEFDIEGSPIYDLTRERPGVNGSPAPVQTSANGDSAVLQQFANTLIEELRRSRNGDAANPAADAALEMVTKASERAMDIVVKQTPQAAGPDAMIATFTKLMEMTQRRGGGLEEALQQAIVKKILEPPAAPLSPLEQMKPLIELFKELRGGEGLSLGAAAVGKADWKSILAEKALDNLPELIKTLQEIFNSRVKEADALRLREEARARTAETVRSMQRPGAPPVPAIPPAAAAPPSSQGTPGTAAVPPEPGNWRGGLDVVPLEGTSPAPAPEASAFPPEASNEAAVIDRFLKARVVQLIQQNVDVAMLVDFIDGANPAIGAMLTKASESQIREFLAGDPILSEALKVPRFDHYLRDLVTYLHEEIAEEEDTEEVRPFKPN